MVTADDAKVTFGEARGYGSGPRCTESLNNS